MTLDSKLSKAVYQGNGSTTVFPFAFKVWDSSHIAVTVTDAAGVSTDVTSNSTVTLASSGGSVTYPKTGSPLPSGAKLAITRNMPFTQGINLTTASRFDPQVLEDGLDQGTAERQQMLEQMARAVILPPTSNESPEDVVQSIYASRDAAAASASAASAQATAAQNSADMAAHSAETAAQTVQMATADAVTAATTQANAAQNAAAAAAQSALDAAAAVPDTLVERVTATETKNTQQDTRLTSVESGVTAISTTLIGSIQTLLCADSYVPNGCVPANGGEYTRAQFPSLYDTYLVGGKLLTCTYAAWAAQVAITGNCGKFALDTVNQKFKVPLFKDGDSITQASSAAELGKSVKAGLPDAIGELPWWVSGTVNTAIANGMFKWSTVTRDNNYNLQGTPVTGYYLKAALSNSSPIYGNSTTVTDEQVRLRHFVVMASAQNNASVFDWSNYMAGLAGKMNVDCSNALGNAIKYYLHVRDVKPTGTHGGTTTGSAWNTRDLNTVVINRIDGSSLSANRITLPPGRYFIRACAPCYVPDKVRLALYNYTASTYMLYGISDYAPFGQNGTQLPQLSGEIEIAVETTIELRMWVQTGYATSGCGVASGITGVPEYFSEVIVCKM